MHTAKLPTFENENFLPNKTASFFEIQFEFDYFYVRLENIIVVFTQKKKVIDLRETISSLFSNQMAL